MDTVIDLWHPLLMYPDLAILAHPAGLYESLPLAGSVAVVGRLGTPERGHRSTALAHAQQIASGYG